MIEHTKKDYFDFLYNLRKLGYCNMWESPIWLKEAFNISINESRAIFNNWVKNFDKKRA